MANGRRGAGGGGDSGHDCERDRLRVEGIGLFIEAAEYARISRFEAHNLRALLCMGDQQFLLRCGGAKAFLAYGNQNRLTPGQFQDIRRHQPVVDDNICFVQQAAGLQCQEFWITRPCAHDRDAAARLLVGVAVQQTAQGALCVGFAAGIQGFGAMEKYQSDQNAPLAPLGQRVAARRKALPIRAKGPRPRASFSPDRV